MSEQDEPVSVGAEIVCDPSVADGIRDRLREFVVELVEEIGEPGIIGLMTADLRARIAEALREDLQRAVPPVELFPGSPKLNSGMGRNEYDLADAVIAAIVQEESTEYAVRYEWGEIVERPSREAAERTLAAVTSRGGTAALIARRVIRSGWQEKTAAVVGSAHQAEETK